VETYVAYEKEDFKKWISSQLLVGYGIDYTATVDRFIEVTGIQYSLGGALSKTPLSKVHLDFILFHLCELAFPSVKYDDVTLTMVVEHFNIDVSRNVNSFV
jgi:hypothetical protein